MENLVDFLEAFQVETLNVAGPRGSQWDQARETTHHIIKQLIRQLYP